MAGFNFSQNIIGLNKINKELTELTENKVDWVSNGVLGAKNLNSFPYYHTSGRVINNVTWTVDSDGILTANGQATGGNSDFNCHYHTGTESNYLILPKGNYIFSGCPSGGSLSTYYIQIGCTRAGEFTVLGRDLGEGVKISLTESTRINITCRIYRNYTASNLTFYPMIRFATDKDSTWQPYAMTNKELTDVVNNVPITAGTYTLQAVRNADNTITYSWV